MPTLQVRDVPEEIYQRLAEAAKRERRSLTQQAVVILARGLDSVDESRQRRASVLEEIHRTIDPNVTQKLPNVVELLRQDRDR